MTRREILQEIAHMSPAERILLAQDLWETIGDDPSAWEPTPAQRQELDRRLAAYGERRAQGLPAGASWEEVKERARQQP